MKKVFLFLAAFAALVSCSKENPVDNTQPTKSVSITLQATAPGTSDDTKTTLVDHSLVHWTKGDAIKVGFPVSSTLSSTVDCKSGVFTSTFNEETSASAFFSISGWNWYYKYNSYTGEYSDSDAAYTDKGIALYPSSANFESVRTGSRGVYYNTQIDFTLTADQTAVLNNFGSGLCFSTAEVSKSDFNANTAQLAFKNECALIKVVLPAAVSDIKSISVTSISDAAPLAGKFNYSNTTGAPTFPISFDIAEGVTSVVLTAPGEETLAAGGTYYIVTCPGTHSSGLAFVFTNAEGKTCRKTVSSEVVLEKSKIDEFKFKTIAYEEAIDYTKAQVGDYFYSDGSFSTSLDGTKKLVGVVFYTGSQHMTDDETLAASEYKDCNHGLVVASTTAGSGFLMSSTAYSYDSWATTNGLLSTKDYSWSGSTTDNAKKLTGYNNTQAFVGNVYANSSLSSAAVTALNNINTNNVVNGVSCWFLPTIAECNILCENLSVVNEKLSTDLSGTCWTVSEENSGGYTAKYDLSTGIFYDANPTNSSNAYLPIFAF